MTGKEIYDALNAYLKEQPVPDWAKEELEEAVRLGITDGTEPMVMIPRYQAAIMAKRAAEMIPHSSVMPRGESQGCPVGPLGEMALLGADGQPFGDVKGMEGII